MRSIRLLATALAAGALSLVSLRADDQASAAATAQGLCDALVSSMKAGAAAGFTGRRQLLDSEVRHAFDLALMTRLIIGPPWRGMTPEQQRSLVEAFSDFSVATYASQFSGYGGEVFSVDPTPTREPSGDVVVHTKLKTKDPEPVRLDYLMREEAGQWRIFDVYLNGTISELAARRSEYSAVLRAGGADALIELLRKKTAQLSG